MEKQKVLADWILATKDTIFVLQEWLNLLEKWQSSEGAEPDEFAAAGQQLREAGLWAWATEAGGHGIQALAEAIDEQGKK